MFVCVCVHTQKLGVAVCSVSASSLLLGSCSTYVKCVCPVLNAILNVLGRFLYCSSVFLDNQNSVWLRRFYCT